MFAINFNTLNLPTIMGQLYKFFLQVVKLLGIVQNLVITQESRKGYIEIYRVFQKNLHLFNYLASFCSNDIKF